jgi:carbamoylphosphate synthase large subunit
MKREKKIIWVCNMGVEKFWKSREKIEFPRLVNNMETAIINRYEEVNIWLTEPEDILVLRHNIDPQYADYLKSLGISLPKIRVTQTNGRQDLSISQLILEDNELLKKIRLLTQNWQDVTLVPHGVSEWEEKLVRECSINLHGVSPSIAKKVNSKTYGVQLSKELELADAGSRICRNFDELKQAFKILASEKKDGEKIVLKEVMGASGSGHKIINNPKEFETILKFMERNFNDIPEFEILIEKWLPRKADFNTQITIYPDGDIAMDGSKQLFTKKNGIHQGHSFPVDEEVLSQKEREQLKDTVVKVGKKLYRDGYWGVVGMDSLKTEEDELIPMVEINCRYNMASYLEKIIHKLAKDQKIFSKYFEILLKNPLSFEEVTEKLIGPHDLFVKEKGTGILVNNFAVLNANFPVPEKQNNKPVRGRLFCVFIHESMRHINEMERRLEENLRAFHHN